MLAPHEVSGGARVPIAHGLCSVAYGRCSLPPLVIALGGGFMCGFMCTVWPSPPCAPSYGMFSRRVSRLAPCQWTCPPLLGRCLGTPPRGAVARGAVARGADARGAYARQVPWHGSQPAGEAARTSTPPARARHLREARRRRPAAGQKAGCSGARLHDDSSASDESASCSEPCEASGGGKAT